MSFPTSPTDGQIHNDYKYNATLDVWKKFSVNDLFPIGMLYTQYPGKNSPIDLGWPGTWENKSTEFAGDFFRAEGGDASTFEGGRQSNSTAVNGLDVSNNGSHNHGNATGTDGYHSHSGSTTTDGNHRHSISSMQNQETIKTNASGPGFYYSGTYYTDYDGSHNHSLDINSNGDHSHHIPTEADHSHSLSGDTETRPVNQTIRIWERTA